MGNRADRQSEMRPAIPRVPVSVGELLDKLSILAIKLERITEPMARSAAEDEWRALDAVRRSSLAGLEHLLADACAELYAVNVALWDIEDAIRRHEAEGRFDDAFVQLARSVYRTNDRRAAIKRRINSLSGSVLREVKAYTVY